MNNQAEDRLEQAFETARTAAQRVPTDEQQARARERFLLEARGESVSLNGDMRHRVQTGALSEPYDLKLGEERMKRIYTRRTRLIAAVMLGVLLAGGFWATPALRTFAQSLLGFFTPIASDNQATLVPLDYAPRPEQLVDANPYSLTLDDVGAQVDFARVPTSLPANYQFTGAEYRADEQRVQLEFTCGEFWSLSLIEQRSDTAAPAQEVGASAQIIDVPIRETVGQYVRGAWLAQLDEIGTPEASDQGRVVSVPQVWTNVADWQQLVWREDGINFTLSSSGSIGQIDAPAACALTNDSFALVAQSLQPAS